MEARPWPIVVLATLQFLSPFAGLFLTSWLSDVSAAEYFNFFYQKEGVFFLFDFFGLYFIAGYALYKIKWWSLPIFLTITLWNLFYVYNNHAFLAGSGYLPLLFGVYGINLGFVAYFLVPVAREPYFNRDLRWWENLPRYHVLMQGSVEGTNDRANCTITDVSEGGVFLKTDLSLKPGSDIRVNFSYFNLLFSLDGRVMHRGTSRFPGLGVRFIEMSRGAKRDLRNLIQALARLKVERRPAPREPLRDFQRWVKRLFKTGQGIFPERTVPRKEENPKPMIEPLAPVYYVLKPKKKTQKSTKKKPQRVRPSRSKKFGKKAA